MSTEKKLILLVEDDPFTLKVYKRKLESAGFEIIDANNGVTALDLIKEKHPSLVFVDLLIPKKDGFELIKDVKADSTIKQIPVVVLTNLSQQQDIDRLKNSGITDYLVKSDTAIQEIVDKAKEMLGEQ